ncbi:hypothetical protein IFM89_028681 [Coptis chinensis]|uniref:F-box domain-containing protein n=1 Tax=Coptis chinensis TaxID=261450 RepID=A0A835H103_9MAGN|nr:hypothetical protein IFM89_028681 [Coptis chinensis]
MEKKEDIPNATLPEAIIEDILIRLPLKSLARFRCVSKKWNDLSRDSRFIQMHNTHSKNRNQLYLLTDYNEEPNPGLLDLMELSIDIKSCPECVVLGDCNGVFLVYKIYDNHLPDTYWLLNPCTGECVMFPEPPCEDIDLQYNKDNIHYGFGYSENDKDYKVVRIRSICVKEGHAIPIEVMVYTLRSNSWRKIKNSGDVHVPFILQELKARGERGAHVNGFVHWAASDFCIDWRDQEEWSEMYELKDHTSSKIIAFDFGSDTFQEVPYPEYYGVNLFDHIGICTLDGNLCLHVYGNSWTHIWVMREYGLRESWTKLCFVSGPILHPFRILHFTNADEKLSLLLQFRHLYFTSERRLEKVYDLIGHPTSQATLYVESLVGLTQR